MPRPLRLPWARLWYKVWKSRDDCNTELLLGVRVGGGNKEMNCCYPRETVERTI